MLFLHMHACSVHSQKRSGRRNFGGYVRILQDQAAWVKVGSKLDRGTFVAYLERVRGIRNDMMHFDPDGVDVDDLKELRDFAGLLKQVKQLG